MVQAEVRLAVVIVDQAQIRRNGFARDAGPNLEEALGNRRLRLSAHRMRALVAITAFSIRYPAELTGIAHANTQRRSGLGHRLRKERCCLEKFTNLVRDL